MFIELTNINGRKEFVNLSNVTNVSKSHDDKTVVNFRRDRIFFEDDYERVKDLIRHELAAERGY